MSGYRDDTLARLKLTSLGVSASIEPQASGRVAVEAILAVYEAARAAHVTGSRT